MIDTDALFRIGDTAEDNGDFDLARRSFERGAAMGAVNCLTRLAGMYDVGIGTPIDKALAMSLYQKAWRRGHCTTAANNIAILYRELGNTRSMFRWFQRCAEEGDGSAQLDMAKCYLEGIGVRKDVQAALRCLAVAARSISISEMEREETKALVEILGPRAL